tara:strand:+ start:4073 stop:4339 length:267 start_codon:yes stop_codon:yes gene_type:complete
MITFWSVDFFKWITNNIIQYEYQTILINSLILIQIGYLVYRLWNYKNIEKDKKTHWTILLFIFNFITCLIYIWKKDDEFRLLNGEKDE